MNKKIISRIILALMIISNVYLVWRVNSNTMSIASYDAGISQRSGVGKLESFWTKYVGGSKSSTSYEDRTRAESDSSTSIALLFAIDAVAVVALYFLNKKPKPVEAPLTREEEWARERRAMRRRR